MGKRYVNVLRAETHKPRKKIHGEFANNFDKKKKRCMFLSRNTSCPTAHSATLQQHVNQLMDFSLQLSFFYPTYPIVIPVSLSPLYIIPACIIAYTK